MIREKYPGKEWRHVFLTDVSAIVSIQAAGSGVFSEEFIGTFSAGVGATNFDPLVLAVLKTAEFLKTNKVEAVSAFMV